MNDEIFQESPRKKAEWLAEAKERIPVFSRVRIVKCDLAAYVGQVGVVQGYDVGQSGEWPTISVEFQDGIEDGFFDDEIELVEAT